jgi:PadR family transcriptional regulator, regulatory protein AphA
LEEIRLTPTSYIVLGLLAQAHGVTPYDLKAMVAGGIGNLWSLQHTQLYAEPERLTKAGYLTETREDGGRRRKLYSITSAGREALAAWLGSGPGDDLPEVRDIGLLKVYFGADPSSFAAKLAEVHRVKLREYEALEEALRDDPELAGPLTALRAGLGHEREWVRYWTALAGESET